MYTWIDTDIDLFWDRLIKYDVREHAQGTRRALGDIWVRGGAGPTRAFFAHFTYKKIPVGDLV